MFSGQVIPVVGPLPSLPEEIWSSCVSIRKIVKNGTVEYKVEFAYPSKGDAHIDELVRGYVSGVVDKLPR
jgi:hypothetical protein